MNFLSYKGLKQQNICTTFVFRSKIFGLFCTYFDFCFVLCLFLRTFERASLTADLALILIYIRLEHIVIITILLRILSR